MNEKLRFGPANPHPLSQLKTELVWEGKYDEDGIVALWTSRVARCRCRRSRRLMSRGVARPPKARSNYSRRRAREFARNRDNIRRRCSPRRIRPSAEMARTAISATGSSGATTSSSWPACSPSSKADRPHLHRPAVRCRRGFHDGRADWRRERTVDKDQSTLEMVAYRERGAKAPTPICT